SPLPSGSLTAGQTYYYVVTAVNSSGYETIASNELSGTATAANGTLQLAWVPSTLTGLDHYNVYRGTAPGAESTLIASVPAGTTTFNDDNTETPVKSNTSPPGVLRTETITFYNGDPANPASIAPANSTGHINVQLATTDNQDAVAQKIITALHAAIIDGGFNQTNYTLSDIGNGRIEVGGAASTSITVDPKAGFAANGGALTSTPQDPFPLILWGDTQRDALVGNSGAGGAGAYNFWFNTGATVFVDKTAPATGADGTTAHPYSTIQQALADPGVIAAAAANLPINVRVEGNANATLAIANTQTGANYLGKTFQVSAGNFSATFEFTSSTLPTGDTNLPIVISAADTASDLASKIQAALNAAAITLPSGATTALSTFTTSAAPDGGDVTVGAPAAPAADSHYSYVMLYQGRQKLTVSAQNSPFNALVPGVTQPALMNNAPYLVGTDQFGNLLPDNSPGANLLQLPKDVVLMVDAGAVFKLDHANIEVGSASSIDNSASALQVLGVPGQQAVFTSYNDDSIAANQTRNLHPGVTVHAGDWGGLVFNNDSDLESLGVFLNNVDEALINYGGGQVFVNGVPNFYDALYLNTARPTLADNTIINSAGAAISANPDSFQTSRFETDLAITVSSIPTQVNGQVFLVDGTQFEFENNGVYAQGNVPISFAGMTTTAQVAASMAAAINASLFGSTVDRAEVIGSTVTLPGSHTFKQESALVTAPPQPETYVADYQRFGPDVHGNTLTQAGAQNTINGLFIRINTQAGQVLDTLDVSAEFASTDIPYVLEENLVLHDNAGGNLQITNPNATPPTQIVARLAGQLRIDPGVLVKISGARIEAGMGANLTAEGTPAQPIVFTSFNDSRYGGGGTFDTADTGKTVAPKAGDWGGFYFWPTSSGSFDHTLITFGGGNTAIEGGFASFSAVEIHQAKVRIADSTLENNANGVGDFVGDRNGRAVNDASTIYVLGAQPVIVNNVIQNNQGAAISTDVDSLNSDQVPDWGRGVAPAGGYPILNNNLPAAFDAGSTGPLVERFSQFDDNHGPLVRLNKIGGNAINGMVIRGGTLETSSIWDDTDIVHVLEGSVTAPNFASVGGLRLESSATQSLVVKSLPGSGFIAGGQPLDISDRIGGEIQVIGTPQHPVVLTSFKDDSVGAGLTPSDQPDNDTNGDGASKGSPGDWGTTDPNSAGSSGGLIFDQYSNDRNVAVINEAEPALTGGKGTNETPATAQSLGLLAPNQQSGDDNSRLGFEVHGTISPDFTQDVDTYTFKATAGTQVWLDMSGTSSALDAVLELVDANGNVLARSDNSLAEQEDAAAAGDPLSAGPLLKGLLPNNLAQPLQDGMFTQATGGQTNGMNFWSTNAHDPGMRVVLPGAAGVNNYYVRVYSKNSHASGMAQFTPGQGTSGGQYQLQVRLQEQVEVPGSEVQYADIRYATTGIDVEGLPAHSPLIANSTGTGAGSQGSAQDLGDLITSDTSSINVGGNLTDPATVNWYKFELTYAEIQVIGPPSGKTWSTVFDVGYADGLTRPNTEIDVYDSAGNLIYVGRDSNVADQQPRPNAGLDANELDHSSFGTLDPFIGPAQLETGTPNSGIYTYYVAIHSDAVLPTALDGTFNSSSSNYLVRLEPVDSINRVVEDHIGSEGGQTAQDPSTLTPLFGATPAGAAGPGAPTGTIAQLNSYAAPYSLSDVVLFVNTPGSGGHLTTVNPFSGVKETDQGQDTVGGTFGYGAIAMRNDGLLYGLTTGNTDANSGQYTQIDTGTAAPTVVGSDGIATYYLKPGNPPAVTADNVGIQVSAMAFVQNGVGPGDSGVHLDRKLYVIGNDFGRAPFTNGLYQLFPDTGAVVPPNQGGINPVPQTAGPPSQPMPVLVTGLSGGERITGMAYVSNTMYVVTDRGNLYSLSLFPSASGTARATFIANVGGQSLSFEGLSAGPPDVEGGKYKNVLFATAGNSLYAFDTNGAFALDNGHGIFSNDNGKTYSTSINVGATGQIAFSTLDYNLWHVTDHRQGDPGHNINVAPDQSRNSGAN
ncbi:MAG TPA: PPC domain-containing protein, partial [Pirellulales bacterium]|nr:PPC domain-containing protein [Pirellulales bacterium]